MKNLILLQSLLFWDFLKMDKTGVSTCQKLSIAILYIRIGQKWASSAEGFKNNAFGPRCQRKQKKSETNITWVFFSCLSRKKNSYQTTRSMHLGGVSQGQHYNLCLPVYMEYLHWVIWKIGIWLFKGTGILGFLTKSRIWKYHACLKGLHSDLRSLM